MNLSQRRDDANRRKRDKGQDVRATLGTGSILVGVNSDLGQMAVGRRDSNTMATDKSRSVGPAHRFTQPVR